MKRSMTNTKAFVSGFIDGFGGIGQVFEPVVGGTSVIAESQAPSRITRFKCKFKSVGTKVFECKEFKSAGLLKARKRVVVVKTSGRKKT